MDDIERYIAKRRAKSPAFAAAYEEGRTAGQFANAVWLLRDDMGLSQRAFAQRVGLPQSTIARIEAGDVLPTIRTLTKIAEKTSKEMKFQFI